jgi:hypothetical protein
MTTNSLVRAAGLAAALAGLIFIAVQINHPSMVVDSVTSTEWVLRNTAKVVFAALALAGITGVYLRQVRQTGVLGLIGYLVLSAGFLIIGSIAFVGGYILPALADKAPDYVNDILTTAEGGSPTGDIGAMQVAFIVSGLTYVVGGAIFGIALFRARVLARWAAVLLAVGTVATLALKVLPPSFDRPFAVPTGVALIGLGLSLWRDQRRNPSETAVPATRVEPSPVR